MTDDYDDIYENPRDRRRYTEEPPMFFREHWPEIVLGGAAVLAFMAIVL